MSTKMMEILQDADKPPSPVAKKKKKKINRKPMNEKPKKSEKKVKEEDTEHWFDTLKSSLPNELEPLDIVVNGVKMVKCRFCTFQMTTRHRSVVKIHMRVHTGIKPYSCLYCEEKFSERATILSHVRSVHPSKSIFKCSLCKILFFDRTEFEAHDLRCVKRRSFECHLCKFKSKKLFMYIIKDHMRRMHTGEKTVSCEQCDQTFVSKMQLFNHMQQHQEVMRFQCSLCKVRFLTESRCQKHENKCLNRRRFECHICKYSKNLLTLDMLRMHMRKHTGEKPFQCEHCHKYFPRQEALNQHLQRHRDLLKFKCSKCYRRFWHSSELGKHESKCHKRRYECHLCGYTKYGMSYNKFRRHMITHIGEKFWECMKCSETFSGPALVHRHFHDKHPELLKLVCPNCHRQFATRNDRDAHQTFCQKQRFECYLCKQTSISKTSLEHHMTLKHTAEARFKCKLCPRKYNTENNLKIHQNVHTKANLVKCDYCRKKFSHIKYKKKHEFQCKKIYECFLCKESFRSFAILQGVHMRSHLSARPYDCKHCTKTFVSIRMYKLHVIAEHLHQYKFQCTVCSGIIVNNKDVATHQKMCMKPIRQSAGVIYFKCSLCGVGLSRKPELRAHIILSQCTKLPKKSR